VTGSGGYSTSNGEPDPFCAMDVDTWRWEVIYSGDDNNEGVTSECGKEQFTIDNNTTD
jgi:hypothetical protein